MSSVGKSSLELSACSGRKNHVMEVTEGHNPVNCLSREARGFGTDSIVVTVRFMSQKPQLRWHNRGKLVPPKEGLKQVGFPEVGVQPCSKKLACSYLCLFSTPMAEPDILYHG